MNGIVFSQNYIILRPLCTCKLMYVTSLIRKFQLSRGGGFLNKSIDRPCFLKKKKIIIILPSYLGILIIFIYNSFIIDNMHLKHLRVKL